MVDTVLLDACWPSCAVTTEKVITTVMQAVRNITLQSQGSSVRLTTVCKSDVGVVTLDSVGRSTCASCENDIVAVAEMHAYGTVLEDDEVRWRNMYKPKAWD